MGIIGYTALSMNKFSGEQMWYVNERNEAAEAIGSDFFNIGSECLRYDGRDIDANGFTTYLAFQTKEDCLDACRESADCVGIDYQLTDQKGYCGLITSSMTDGQFVIGLTLEQRQLRSPNADNESYTCIIKRTQAYQL